MNIDSDFIEIMNYAHYWNWLPDWDVTQKIYQKFPDSYSVFTPFVYSYLEELIRSTTSEYGKEILDSNGKQLKRKVGRALINLAIEENKEKNNGYIEMLKESESYFNESKATDSGNNRNSVDHGYIHSRFWDKDSFERPIHDVARISKYANF